MIPWFQNLRVQKPRTARELCIKKIKLFHFNRLCKLLIAFYALETQQENKNMEQFCWCWFYPRYFKPNCITCQSMTQSLLKPETSNTFYVSDYVFKLFPCSHCLLWVLSTQFLCGTSSSTSVPSAASPSTPRDHYSAVLYKLWSRNKHQVVRQQHKKEKQKSAEFF